MSSAAIFGGNFNPVHNGHLITALKVFEQRKIDKIIFIPAFISPFKTSVPSAHHVHRINMLKAALNGIPYFELSDIELKKEGISYTIDTLKELKDYYSRLELIIGFDNLVEFTKWKDPDEIIKLASLVVLKRAGQDTEHMKNKYFGYAAFPDTPVIEISSTDIRKRVRDNQPIDFLVPEKVKEYIFKNNLYKE
jgi:nicotinate-nucleotide adenylyltransferase